MLKLDRKKLDLAMAKNCYTTLDLARKSGVCYSSIMKLSGERMTLTNRTLGKLANALNVEPKELIQD